MEELYWTQVNQEASHNWGNLTGGFGDDVVGVVGHIGGEDLVSDAGEGVGAGEAGVVGVDAGLFGGGDFGFLFGGGRGSEDVGLELGIAPGDEFGEDERDAHGLLEGGDLDHSGGAFDADRVLAVVHFVGVASGAVEADEGVFPGRVRIFKIQLEGEADGEGLGVQPGVGAG